MGVNEKTFFANQPSPDNQMVGLEHNGEKQTNAGGMMFNMILQDGTKSDNAFIQFGIVRQRYEYFLPQNNRVTAVTIYYNHWINGFRFHLSDGSNWDIGMFGGLTQTVKISDNEVIVGFKAKSKSDCPAQYVEWQFITAKFIKFD